MRRRWRMISCVEAATRDIYYAGARTRASRNHSCKSKQLFMCVRCAALGLVSAIEKKNGKALITSLFIIFQ